MKKNYKYLINENDFDKLMEPKSVEIEYIYNILEIKLNQNLSYDTLITKIKELLSEKILKKIPYREMIFDKDFQKQSLYILEQDNKVIFIIATRNIIKIVYKEFKRNFITEIRFDSILSNKFSFNCDNRETQISIFNKKYTGKIIDEKKYISSKIETLKEKVDYFSIVKKFIDELFNIPSINKIISKDILYDSIGIINSDSYDLITKDDEISLYRNKCQGALSNNENFIIVLNITSEKMGNIGYNLKDKVSYTGNVDYAIKETYRNRGYVTRALKLLKEVVKNLKIENKNLYVSAFAYNIPSIRVAEKNGGELVYCGKMPENILCMSTNETSQDRSFKIYKIKI